MCFGGLPRFFVGNGLCVSAALRNKPARFRASLFSFPAGIMRAASSASMALASQSSSVSGEGWVVWFNGSSVLESCKLDNLSRDHKKAKSVCPISDSHF